MIRDRRLRLQLQAIRLVCQFLRTGKRQEIRCHTEAEAKALFRELEDAAGCLCQYVHADVPAATTMAHVETPRHCRVCGCTDVDCSECIERTGQPCHWIEDDLCSACAGKEEGAKP